MIKEDFPENIVADSSQRSKIDNYLLCSRPPRKLRINQARKLKKGEVKKVLERASLDVSLVEQIFRVRPMSGPNEPILAVFNKAGNLVAREDIEKGFKWHNGFQVTTPHYGLQGVFMKDDLTLFVFRIADIAGIWRGQDKLYTLKNLGQLKFFHNFFAEARSCVLVKNKVFYVAREDRAVCIELDRGKIDRGEDVETVLNTVPKLVDIWADRDWLYSLSKTGEVVVQNLRKPTTPAITKHGIVQREFADDPFTDNGHSATAITGCNKYLAVSVISFDDQFNTIHLLNRKADLLTSSRTDRKAFDSTMTNCIQKMAFILAGGVQYLLASHYYDTISLFLVNPIKKVDFTFIRSLNIRKKTNCYSLVQQSSTGEIITGSMAFNTILRIKIVMRKYAVKEEQEQEAILKIE